MKRSWLLALFLPSLLIVALVVDYQRSLNRPLGLTKPMIYQVAPGISLRRLAAELSQQDLLQRPRYWEFHARRSDLAARIRAGEFELRPEMTAKDLLTLFTSGQMVQYSLTIPEGWTFRQLLAALHAHPYITATLEDEDVAGIMGLLGMPEAHPEGWFFPDTYAFPRGTTDLEFLRRAHQRMQRALHEVWEERQADLPLRSAYEALILASIIERETGRADERERVSAVFTERLRRGMRLQTDPTVIYGMEQFDGRIRRSDLRRDTPYNTYLHAGLPPTPIGLPGLASLRAAVNPADEEVLFFVSRGDGSHHFSKTYEEHRRAVIDYLLGGDASRYGR